MEVDILFNIIIVIIGLYLAFFKSYFQEKGKNIATSEDIEELTHKVESVKQSFIEKNASLKAKLDLLTNLQINHKNEERNSLIEFHKVIKGWIGLLTESSPSLKNDYDINEIQAKNFQYDFAYRKVLDAEALLDLYLEDQKLYNLIYDLKINVINHLVPHPTKFLLDLEFNNFEFEQYKEMPSDNEFNILKKTETHKELLKKRENIYKEYGKKMFEGFKVVINYDKEYRVYMREYISKLSTE